MRRLALLLGVAAAAVGVWVMVASGGAEPAPSGAIPETATTEVERVVPVSPAPAQEPRASETEEIANRVEIEAAATPDGEIVRVLVTRKDTGEPVPGAEVSYYETSRIGDLSAAEAAEHRILMRDWEKLTRRYGTTVHADEKGGVFVPLERNLRVTARRGELYAQLVIRPNPRDPGNGQYRIELEQDLTLHVKVLDARGDPAVDVPIELLPQYTVVGVTQSGSEVGITGAPDGVAKLAHLQVVLGRFSQRSPFPTGYLIRPEIPGLLEGTLIDAQEPPEDPIVFRLPGTGRITVEFKDSNGARMSSEFGGSVTIAVAPAEPLADGVRFEPPRDGRWNRARDPDGLIVFDRVVLGRRWVATANPQGEPFQRVFSGPVIEEQDVHLSLQHTMGPYVVVARVVDESGEPVRVRPLIVEYSLQEKRMGRGGGVADDRGFLRHQIPTDENLTGDPVLSRLTLRDEPAGMVYAWEGERALAAGENELGDIPPAQETIVASGRILIDGEVPKPGRIGLALETASGRPAGRSPAVFSSANSRSNLELWFLREGRFEVRGEATEPGYRIAVRDPAFLPYQPLEFTPGDRDLLIDLETGGSAEVEFLADATVPRSDIEARLIPLDGQDSDTEPDPRDPAARVRALLNDRLIATSRTNDRALRWSSLWPGRYRLEVRAKGARTPAATAEVHVTAGERTRIDPIDLRATLRTIDVTLIGADRQPLDPTENRFVVLINETDPNHPLRSRSRLNPKSILVSEPTVDLTVSARGFQPRVLSGVRDDLEVMLESFPEVVIQLADDLVLPEQFTLTASLREPRVGRRNPARSTRMAQLGSPISSRELGEAREVALQVRGDGRYLLSLRMLNQREFGSSTVQGIEPGEIEVQATLGRQVFEVKVPPDEWSAAIDRAKRR